MAGPEPSQKRHDDHVRADGGYASRYASPVPVTFGDDAKGEITVEMCLTCGYVEARCAHEHSSWNENGTQLTCDLCGTDGT